MSFTVPARPAHVFPASNQINYMPAGTPIAAIDHGMGLQGYSAQVKYIVTAFVLLIAVTIDAVARRGRERT